jgi:hypothetical protein
MKGIPIALCIIGLGVALVASTRLATGAASAAPDQRVSFTKMTSDLTPRVRDTFTFTLTFSSTPTEAQEIQVRVIDPNPAPAYLRILTGSITGGATYSPTIDGVVWEGTLSPAGVQPQTVTFQVEITGIPTTALQAGYQIVNTAWLTDVIAPGSPPIARAEAVVRVRPWRIFGPFTARDFCAASSFVASPFSLEIAALHQVVGGSEGRRAVQLMTEQEWLATYDEAFPTLMEALEDSGADWARVYVNWSWIQPDPPPAAYVWGPYHDEKLRLVAETGVHLIGTVDAAPQWAADLPRAHIYCGPECGDTVDRLPDFAQFLTDLVSRYKQPPYGIKHWELMNEPDSIRTSFYSGWADDTTSEDGYPYKKMLETAYAAIKAADPQATVLMGGLAQDSFTEYGGPFDRYFADDFVAYGGGDHMDVLNFHYFTDFRREWERWDPRSNDQRHGWLQAPTCGDLFDGEGDVYEASGIDLIAKATHFRNRMATCYGLERPIWVTEMAEHGYDNDPTSLVQQARYVIQGYARGLAAGVENITWFALSTPNSDGDQALLFDDWTPKPAFLAYQTLTAELTGYEYSHDRSEWEYDGSELGFAYTLEAYVFKHRCEREKTVAWGGGTLVFAPAGQLRITDRDGDVSLVADGGALDEDGVQNGTVELQLTDDPVFVVIDH